MADVNINKFRASVVRDGSKPASPGFIVSEGQDPVDPAGNGQNHLPVTIATTATGLSITDSQVLGGAGTVGQYIRGDGSLADFPQASGGGSSVSYYLNGSISQGTIGGVAYKELNKVPILGAGTQFSINADGYIASFLTDAGDPNLLEIPGGNWNFETYFSASSSGGTPTFYVELYKYDGTTFSLIASSSTSPELIAFGTNLNPYFSTLAVPTTTLVLTDRLAVRFYVTHSGRTITMHTENNTLCQIVTTFTTGLTSLNGLTAQVQNLAVGTSGTDFNIASATATHTFNLPTASATNRGALSSADWTTFNNKQNALGYVPVPETRTITINGVSQDLSANRTYNVGTVTSVGLSSATSGVTIVSSPVTTSGTITLAIATASGSQNGLLSSTDWTTFNNKQNALTNPVTGTGTSGQVAYFTGTTAISSESNLFWDTTNDRLGIGTATPSNPLHIVSNTLSQLNIQALSGNTNAQINLEPSGTGIALIGPANNVDLAFRTNASIKLRLDKDGNLGLGVTPSAWSVIQAMQVLNTSWGASPNNLILYQSSNVFFDGAFKYITTGTASQYRINDNGVFSWLQAPSGTAGNTISFTQAMTLFSTGNLLVGTGSDTGERLQVSGNIKTNSGYIQIVNATNPSLYINNTAVQWQYYLKSNYNIAFSDAVRDVLTLGYNGSPSFFQGGNVGIGTASPSALLTVSSIGFDDTTLRVEQLRSGYASAINLVGANDAGANFNRISSQTNGGTTHWQIGGGGTTNTMAFLTGGTERMRITSGGYVGIGNAANGTGYAIEIARDSNTPRIDFVDNGVYTAQLKSNSGIATVQNSSNNALVLGTNNTERMRITSGGEVLVGTTTTDVNTQGCQLRPFGLGIFVRSGASTLQLNRLTSDGIIASFRTNDIERGSISISGTTTSYNTTSDYRLKEDFKEIKGLEKIRAIKVYDYKWKSYNKRMDGVLAHELAEVLPYAVFGEKDELDEYGNCKMQSVDYSKIVPIMIKSIQELKQEIDTLKN